MKLFRKITLIDIATDQLEDAERGALAAHADLEHAQHVLALNLARVERLREYLAIRKVATTAHTSPQRSLLVKHG